MRLPVHRLPLHPVLFAGYFVLFLYAENLDLVRLSEVNQPLTLAVAGSGLLLAVAGVLALAGVALHDRLRGTRRAQPADGRLRRALDLWARGGLVAGALVVAFMGYGHVAQLAGEEVAPQTLVGGWALLVGAIVVLAVIPRTPIGTLTGGLNVAAVVLVVFALSSIVPHNLQAPTRAELSTLQPSGLTAQRATQRDIFYLVYDRYGSQSSLEAEFGITDNDLPDWLDERGFVVLPRSHANYSRTSLSMASVLNLEHVDELAERMGPDNTDQEPVHQMLQDHLVGRFLREQGYRYVHIGSWFNPTRALRVADESLEADSTTEFEAVLYETTALPLLGEHLGRDEEEMPPADRAHVEHALFQFRALDRVLNDPGPTFVLAHVLLPHDPYVFDVDGRYISPTERANEPIARQFRRQLEFTNRHIMAYVEQLLARPESERPIIIVSADEGPYPRRYARDQLGFDWGIATPAELEAKFGIIHAYYLPDEPDMPADAPEPYDTMSAVNTFRFLLGRYFGVDLPYLPDRVYASRSPRYVYELTDVTDRLPTRQSD